MARSKDESDVRRYITAAHVARFTDARACMTTAAVLWRIENGGTRNGKRAFGAIVAVYTTGARLWELGRTYFENCPLSLTARNHEFVSPWISIESIAPHRRPLTPLLRTSSQLTLKSPADVPRRTTVRPSLLCDADRQGNEKRREEREWPYCFFKESLLFKRDDASAHGNTTLTRASKCWY